MQTTNAVRLRFLLPSLSQLAANPIKIILVFLFVAVASNLLIPDELIWIDLFRIVVFGSVITVVAAAASALGLSNLAPRKPSAPRRIIAPITNVGRQPPTLIPLPMSRCLRCNRLLTNPRSQLAGVGPDCERNYGARPQFQPNPQFAAWEQVRQQARRNQVAAQAQNDLSYQQACIEHQGLVENWRMQLASPAGRARTEATRVSTRALAIDLGAVISLVLSEAVVRLVTGAGLPF